MDAAIRGVLYSPTLSLIMAERTDPADAGRVESGTNLDQAPAAPRSVALSPPDGISEPLLAQSPGLLFDGTPRARSDRREGGSFGDQFQEGPGLRRRCPIVPFVPAYTLMVPNSPGLADVKAAKSGATFQAPSASTTAAGRCRSFDS